jgi:hypothetical protein
MPLGASCSGVGIGFRAGLRALRAFLAVARFVDFFARVFLVLDFFAEAFAFFATVFLALRFAFFAIISSLKDPCQALLG